MENILEQNIEYIGGNELVFNTENGIQSGGFSVSSILTKAGISPVMTTIEQTGGSNSGEQKVSDLFQHLAVPNWTTMYAMKGGKYVDKNHDDDDDDIEDDLHDKLLELVKNHESSKKKKKLTKKKLNSSEKKNNTKKNLK